MKKVLSLLSITLLNALSAEGVPSSNSLPTCTSFEPKSRSVMAELYGECLFLQPNGSSIYYAVEAIGLDPDIAVPAVSPNWQVYEIFPDYSPAFNLGARAHFSDMDTAITLNWQRLFSNDRANKTVGSVNGEMIGANSDIGPNSHYYLKAKAKAKFHFDTVNLNFSQRFCAFGRFYPNFFAGGSFARIKQIQHNHYENDSLSVARSIDNYSTFIGAGPDLGFDFDYRIIAGFFLNASTSMAMIIGESQNGTHYKSWSPNLVVLDCPNPNLQKTTVPNRTQLVPALEERLGFSYSGMFSCCKITFGFGYQAQIYLNAIQSFDMTNQVLPEITGIGTPTVDDGLYAVGYVRTLSNFILTGPYINLGLVF